MYFQARSSDYPTGLQISDYLTFAKDYERTLENAGAPDVNPVDPLFMAHQRFKRQPFILVGFYTFIEPSIGLLGDSGHATRPTTMCGPWTYVFLPLVPTLHAYDVRASI